MKRILKALARLYPATWRRRYGAEYEALLEDGTPSMHDAFDVLRGALATHVTSRSFVTIMLPCALAGGLAALAVSFKLPPVYTSGVEFTETTRYIPEDVPHPPGETVLVSVGNPPSPHDGPYGDLIRAVFNRDDLARIIRKDELYPRERARMPLDRVILRMRSAIAARYTTHLTTARYHPWMDHEQKVEGKGAVEFTYPDPQVAQKVDGELGWLLTESAMKHSVEHLPKHDQHLFDSIVLDASLQQDSPPSLPRRPNGLSRGAECGIGLLDGLLCGFVLATFRGPRRDTSVSS